MKIRKTVSAKVIAANRGNATKSTGPRSGFGKSRSKLNALKNGFFAKELYLSADEVSDFKTLQEDLTTELAPKTRLQRLALEHVTCCAWRCKLATRLEMRQISSLVENTNGSSQDVQSTSSRDEAVVCWLVRSEQTEPKCGAALSRNPAGCCRPKRQGPRLFKGAVYRFLRESFVRRIDGIYSCQHRFHSFY